MAIPAGTTIDSATLSLLVATASGQHVNVHRVTAPWEESTVTWNSFAAAYDATVQGGFTADAAEWRSVDVTALVQAWVDGTVPNYGILLDQDDLEYPFTTYRSREVAGSEPWLEICYSSGGQPVCETIVTTADTYIWEATPDSTAAVSLLLYTGRPAEGEGKKQSLLFFPIETEEPQYAAIGDLVWLDENQNGIQDEGETGVEGVAVQLLDCEGNVVAETTTDAGGNYLFDMLEPGDYNVHFDIPDGYVQSPMDQGADDALDSDADTDGSTVCTTLEPGETDLTWDAGIYRPVQEGCTRTIGYWKNWGGFGPQPDMVSQYLPIWLGTDGGSKSVAVTDNAIAHDILLQNVYGSSSNGITKLYAQLLAAKLNFAAGASGDAVAGAVADADTFLAEHDYTDWDGLSRDQKNMVNGWKSTLDQYNNGCIGPGHCDDDPYGEDCEDGD